MNIQVETGSVFSQGFPITLDEGPSNIYSGRVLIIIDALCYSATDFFVAGMQDNGLATILGTAPITGAGGANVWNHSTLAYLVQKSGGSDIEHMPFNLDIDIAMRRSTRIGKNKGLPVEGLGVRAEYVYHLTQNDVLGKNEDLINFASRLLSTL